MDGYRYEQYCARLLRQRGFRGVEVTQSSVDQGVDILARYHGRKYGIQCKYYSVPIGNKAVQEAYAGAVYYGCDVAVVMTNSTFTPRAKELAQKTGVLLWPESRIRHLTLAWAGKILLRILGIIAMAAAFAALVRYRQFGLTEEILPAAILFLAAGGLLNTLQIRFWPAALAAAVCHIAVFGLDRLGGAGIFWYLPESAQDYLPLLFFAASLLDMILLWRLRPPKTEEAGENE